MPYAIDEEIKQISVNIDKNTTFLTVVNSNNLDDKNIVFAVVIE